MKQILHTLVVNQQNRFSNANEPATLPVLMKLNITAKEITPDREQKLRMFQDLYGLPGLESTKELSMAQAMAFVRLSSNSPSFINYLEKTYGSKQQQ